MTARSPRLLLVLTAAIAAILPTPGADAAKSRRPKIGRAELLQLAQGRAHRPIAPGVRTSRDYAGGHPVAASLDYLVRPKFVDLAGKPVDPKLIGAVVVKSSIGTRRALDPERGTWLQGSVVPFQSGLSRKELVYSVERVIVEGANVVYKGQQRFVPWRRQLRIKLLFYSATFVARDAIFGSPVGSGIRLTYPSGKTRRHDFGSRGELTLASLPRGRYHVAVDGPGLSFRRPIVLSRSQSVRLDVITYLDAAIGALALASIAFALLLVRRPHLLRRLRPRRSRRATAPPAPVPPSVSDRGWPRRPRMRALPRRPAPEGHEAHDGSTRPVEKVR